MSTKYRVLAGIAILTFVLAACPVMAQEKPVQLSLFTPIQIFPEEAPIKGIRFNLFYGRSATVSGLDLGLVNHTTTGTSKGAQFGLVGIADANYTGFQDNFINVTKGDFEGFQWGFVNYARRANGFQLGFVNYAGSMKGLQIGLINIIDQGGQFPVFPIVNWSF